MRVLHILSLKAWVISCAGIKQHLSILISTLRPMDAPLCWCSSPSMEFTQYWSKTIWTCRQSLEKSEVLKMLKSFSENSSKVSATEYFFICRIAMPRIRTTFGFVDAVSWWTIEMPFSQREHSVPFTPFLRLPSWLPSEYATKNSLKLSSACQTSPCWVNYN